MALTILKFLPIIVLGLFFLFGGHYFIYRSLVGVFSIENSLFKTCLLAFLLILPAGFFIASFVAHVNQSFLTKYFYVITASWMGLAINLLLAACLIKLTFWLAGLIGLDLNQQIIGAAIFSLAVLFSIYGFWNAFNPRIKSVDVKIKNLPLEWQGKTIVQLSDIHLGHIHGAGFLRDIVEKTNSQKPDLILITGDLFDGMDGDLSVFVKPLSDLEAKNGVFFVTGNHEAYVGLERVMAILEQTDIKVLNNEFVDIEGLQVIGLSYSLGGDSAGVAGEISNEAKIISSLSGFEKNKSSILMYHAPANIDQAIDSGVDLQLSGHTHDGQVWPLNIFTRLIYGSYNYGLRIKGDFSIYTSSGAGTWGPPMRTGNTPEIVSIKIN